MSYLVNIDDMLNVARDIGLPQASDWKERLEALGTEMAQAIGTHLGINYGAAKHEPAALGGTCANFYQKEPGQPLPECLGGLDDESGWND
jgi:hypothetical protein